MMDFFSKTPEPPYYAVIFSSVKSENDTGYGETAKRMVSLAADQPGFLGVESVRAADGRSITVSYWDSMDAINNWKHHTEHQAAKEKGKSVWYESYAIRIANVEKQRLFSGEGND
ncbi:antibiotic biosynthesis monooxygenase family protein [Bacillus tequilensis]|uniref:antibiotic biosynthesis monooxygenase family protein n=1 Tax=Bacillus tequilensis TaxID=227866 RepID=UPI0005164D44|nr:antibiotic biosynthesis monooxygenase [Bacillus tequilensis]MDR4435597.1 antibiotic biosynthesis monooxygenase [Bacillus tequilensis]